MKKSMSLVLAVSAIFLLAITVLYSAGCGGGGGGGGENDNGISTIAIKGSFSGTVTANIVLNTILESVFPSAYALDQSQVAKVIAFNVEGAYWVADVTDDVFSISVDPGAPVGLVFAGAADNFLGYLTLGNGIDALPLTKLESGVTEIDLQTLSSFATEVTSSYNPIGAELVLTSDEQTAIAHSDDFLASVIKNPDVDGNGTIDVLEDRFYRPSILYFVTGGSFAGSNVTPDVNTPAGINSFKFAFDVWDPNAGSFPDKADVFLTVPGGSPAPFDQQNPYSDNRTYFSTEILTTPAAAGDYVVLYSAKTLTFTIPDQSQAENHIVIPVPTVTLNGDTATINRIAWEYKLGSGAGSALDPKTMMDRVEVQIEGSGTRCANYPQGNTRMYNSGNLATETVEHVLGCQNLEWATVTTLHMTYNDLYGNHYVVSWNK